MKLAMAGSAVAQAFNALTGIVVMPVYMALMGEEAFGLVGVFVMVQSVTQLLDFGITPVVAREASLFAAGKSSASVLWRKIRSVELFMAGVAAFAILIVFVSRHWISTGWLTAGEIPAMDIATSLFLMVVASAIRWIGGLYRGILFGLEKHSIVNGFSITFTCLRFLAVVPVLYLYDSGAVTFFAFQCVISVAEICTYRILVYRTLPRRQAGEQPSLAHFKNTIYLAKDIGVLSVLWVLLTQVDKVVLSHTLTLEGFGRFSLAVMAASVFFIVLPTLNQVIQPRMTILVAQQRDEELATFYRLVTQCLSAVFVAAGSVFALYAEPILTIWTNDAVVAEDVAAVLSWYSLANVIVVLLVPSFLLQFAHGDLSLHVRGNLVLLGLLLPLGIVAATHWGPVAVGICYVSARLLFLGMSASYTI